MIPETLSAPQINANDDGIVVVQEGCPPGSRRVRLENFGIVDVPRTTRVNLIERTGTSMATLGAVSPGESAYLLIDGSYRRGVVLC